jgi:hypothetical protein
MPASPKDFAAMAGYKIRAHGRGFTPSEEILRARQARAAEMNDIPCEDYSSPSGLGPAGDTGQYSITSEDELAKLSPQDTPFLNHLLAEGRIKQRLIADIYVTLREELGLTTKAERNRAYGIAEKIARVFEAYDD